MANVQVLNFEKHRSLKLDTSFNEKHSDLRPTAVVSIDELPQLVLDFPVFFKKNAQNGQFELVAVMGFEANENLFVDAGEWRGGYIPRDLKRWPFQACTSSDGLLAHEVLEFRLGIDVDSSRVSSVHGDSVFDHNGELSTCSKEAITVLSDIVRGSKLTQLFVDKLLTLKLIEEVKLKLSSPRGESVDIAGLYSIPSERVQKLSDKDSLELLSSEYLPAIYGILYSQGHISKLISWKAEQG